MAAPLLQFFKTSAVLHACMVATFCVSFTVAQPSTASLSYLCGTTGNYTTNSTYQSNLNTLLPSLAANGSVAGFYNVTSGRSPDQVYGIVLCRGDADVQVCRDCLDTAGSDLLQLCPYTKSAFTWYDSCLLRYSNQKAISSVEDSKQFRLVNTMNITEPNRFLNLLGQLMDGVSKLAAYNSSEKFATGEAKFTALFPRVYGLAQCMRDLTDEQCYQCLRGTISALAPYAQRLGGRVLKLRCNVRYEVYPFFSGKSMLMIPPEDNKAAPVPPAALPPPATPAEGATKQLSRITQIRPHERSVPRKKDHTGLVLSIVIPVASALAFMIIACFYVYCRRPTKKAPLKTNPEAITSIKSILFDLTTLRTATANFSDENKLGEGGFGAVYKGTLPEGQEIAVKRLSTSSGQGLGELKNELVLVAKLQHRNLVKLLGVCLQEQEKLLVYEFMPNRSLDTFLFDPIKRQELDWRRRYKIIEAIARGLLYLHEDSQLKIIHRDLKASNILLDADMNPKISDFGMARLFVPDQTQGTTRRVVGTFGYMAPEYAMQGKLSVKSDVYSFGVLVLEIVTGRKNGGGIINSEDLLSYAWENWTNGTATEILDQSLGEHCPRSEVMRCIQIGLLCVQDHPADRPSMSAIVLMLSILSASLKVPSKPAFCVNWTRNGMGLSTDSHSLSTAQSGQVSGKSVSMSQNEVSVSELEPR